MQDRQLILTIYCLYSQIIRILITKADKTNLAQKIRFCPILHSVGKMGKKMDKMGKNFVV